MEQNLLWMPEGCMTCFCLNTTHFTEYADDNTLFVVKDHMKNVLLALPEISK